MRLENVMLPSRGSHSRWDITVADGIVKSIEPTSAPPEVPAGLLLPPLCHPHIHVDKAYLLTGSQSHPDLDPVSGSFEEALEKTTLAKERYTEEDLYLRGSQLLATSCSQGVTSARVFAEVDHVTGVLPLAVAIRLKKEFAPYLVVQICAFAQDAIFSTQHGTANREVLESALSQHAENIQVLGTTPYVEENETAAWQNAAWAIRTAMKHDLHLDFHLDYNLVPPSSKAPMALALPRALMSSAWPDRKTVVLGHCTQFTLMSYAEMERLRRELHTQDPRVHFVGLPTSDLFMMGRPAALPTGSISQQHHHPHNRPRGTLQVLSMIRDHNLDACLGVNNVGNAFTPFGTGDPLQLASWGVGLYQAGTAADALLLYGCVSWRARAAIGLADDDENKPSKNNAMHAGVNAEMTRLARQEPTVGQRWRPMLLVENARFIELPNVGGDGAGPAGKIPARQRSTVKDVVWDPPETAHRKIVR